MVQTPQTVQTTPDTPIVARVEVNALQSVSFNVGDLVKILFTAIGNAMWFIPSLMIRAISDWTSSSIEMHKETGVPVALHDLMKIVEEKAKSTEGIYRKATSFAELNALTEQVSQGKTDGVKSDMDAHLAACSIKKMLRDMPAEKKVFPATIPNLEGMNEQQKISDVKTIIGSLTSQKKAFLTHMLNHITAVSSHSEVNKMTSSNLALTLMPNLIPQSTDPLQMMADQSKQNAFFMYILENRTTLGI
ncbi:Rho GTPase-activating protein [Simkania sp.]|uniref:Rho GTPase-activating protein n=1 Tax=Simkania sp. TaxID=34094 RepID=UPI003B52724F